MVYTYTPSKLIPGTALPDSIGILYNADSPYGAILKEITLVNTHTLPLTVTIHIVPSGGTPDVATTLLSEETLQPGEQRIDSMSTVLPIGTTIQAVAETADLIAMSASGLVIS